MVIHLPDEIAEGLETRGITLDELIESGGEKTNEI
jgi:hypothetical protein